MSMRVADLFAGCGGFSQGARAAGLIPVWAANHWAAACDVYEKNIGKKPACQDLHQADWTAVPEFDILLGSPCCQGHSKARGKDRPHHDASRSTAWAIPACAEVHRPKAVVVENVKEFLGWALFPAWAEAMRLLGYHLTTKVLDAQNFGVPQMRRRLFIVGTLKKPFVFPEPPVMERVPIRQALDLDKGDWGPIDPRAREAIGKRPLVPNTMARIAEGRRRFGKDTPFWVPYFGSNIAGYSLDRPVWTITTRDRYSIVKGDQYRIFNVDEVRRAMGFPEDFLLPEDPKLSKHLLGNAVVPNVAEWLTGKVAEWAA